MWSPALPLPLGEEAEQSEVGEGRKPPFPAGNGLDRSSCGPMGTSAPTESY